MDLEVIDFDQICRACKCITPYMRPIFEAYQNARESPRINEMLMACASVQVVPGDGLPSQICQICVEQLNNAFIFKHQCEKSDASLREYAKNMKVNEIKEELQSSDFMESLDTLSNLLNEQQSFSREVVPDEVDPLVTPKMETEDSDVMDNIEQPFTCQQCPKVFKTLEELRCHECIPTDNMYILKHCDKEYTRLNHLQCNKQLHNRKKMYVCKICNKTSNKLGHLKRHMMTHLRQKPFSCKTCNRGFNRLENLQIHTPKCNGDTVYPCGICNKIFNREDSFEVHKKTHDNQQPKLLTIENLDKIEDYYYEMDEDVNFAFSDHSDVDDSFEPQIRASAVSETSAVTVDNDNGSSVDERTNDSIESEMDITKEIKEEEELIDVKEDEDDDNADIVEDCFSTNSHSADEPFQSTKCTKSYNKDNHQKRHERQSHFECDICQKSFRRTDSLVKHKASKHGVGEEIMAEKKYECSLCQKSFTTKKNRDVHVTGHTGQKAHQCKVCQKTFLSKSYLAKHMKCHDEDSKKFLCSECGQRFVRNDYLVIHMRRHRGEKPFKCKFCEKGFTRTTDLNVHERGHTGEKTHLCMICGKLFGRPYNYTLHMRTHTGTKPYQCTYCNAAFAQSGDLKAHLGRHTGEKFQCEVCTKTFLTNKALVQHKRTIQCKKSKSSVRADTSNNNEEQLVNTELSESS